MLLHDLRLRANKFKRITKRTKTRNIIKLEQIISFIHIGPTLFMYARRPVTSRVSFLLNFQLFINFFLLHFAILFPRCLFTMPYMTFTVATALLLRFCDVTEADGISFYALVLSLCLYADTVVVPYELCDLYDRGDKVPHYPQLCEFL